MIIFAAFMIALIASLLFAPGYRTGSYAPFIILFFILFFAAMAGQYWIVPFGPTWWGVSWGPILFIVLIFAFLFATPSPYDPKRTVKNSNDTTDSTIASATISVFVWLLLIFLIMAILLGHYKTAL